MPSLPPLPTNFSSGSQTVRVRCMLPDFNFFLQTEKQTSVLFFCGWEAFKDYFADLVLTRLPRKKHKSPRHTPMWATFLTFQKVLKSVWAGGSPLNLDNAQKIGCFFLKSSPLERKLFLGAISSSCHKTHRTLVFRKKKMNHFGLTQPKQCPEHFTPTWGFHPVSVSTEWRDAATY